MNVPDIAGAAGRAAASVAPGEEWVLARLIEAWSKTSPDQDHHQRPALLDGIAGFIATHPVVALPLVVGALDDSSWHDGHPIRARAEGWLRCELTPSLLAQREIRTIVRRGLGLPDSFDASDVERRLAELRG